MVSQKGSNVHIEKRIVCFDDSSTDGFDALDGSRLSLAIAVVQHVAGIFNIRQRQ